MKIVTSEQMRQIEARSEQAGVSTDALMEKAGLAVARRVRHHAGPLIGVPITVLVGPGNNGGDGLVTARHLVRWGARVWVYLCAQRRQPDPKLAALDERGVVVRQASEDDGLRELTNALARSHVVVDSVLGTGRARPLEGTLREVFLRLAETAAAAGPQVIALDLPSGLDADSGSVDPACAGAHVTVTLGYPKLGLFAFPGADKIGALEVADIGIPAGLDEDVGLELMTDAWAAANLPVRPSDAHKGTFGRTMVVAGSANFVGAAQLAVSAATRVGAGLVTLAIPSSLQAAVAAKVTEPTYLPLPESSPGEAAPEAARQIADRLEGYDSVLVGCGLGQAPGTIAMAEELLLSGSLRTPTVVDADGLNILAQSNGVDWWERLSGRAVVTPHPGEMARLTGETTGAIQKDRLGAATASARRWNKVTVLKGAYTIVASPDGSAKVSPFANPGLASAGTGDVLAGVIAGLLSQRMTLEDAAALGVFLHGAAGEVVRQELGAAGMIAGDLLPALPRAMRDLRGIPTSVLRV